MHSKKLVRGHQYRNVGPLTLEAELNKEADRLAGEMREASKPEPIHLPAAKVTLWKGDQQITRGIKRHLERE